jgi:ABC-2 type transport system permease protein
MIAKIWAIAYNGIYRTFQDPLALLFMFGAPLGISIIMGWTFGDVDDINLPESKLVVVNLDEGFTTTEGNTLSFGDYYVSILASENTPEELQEFVTGEVGTDPANARDKVKTGDVRAALIIPPDFSAKVFSTDQRGTVELYYNPGDEVGVTITISVVETITTIINSGQVAQSILINDTSIEQQITASILGMITQNTAPSEDTTPFIPFYTGQTRNLVTLNQTDIEGTQDDLNILSYYAPSMAILFMTFAMSAGTRGILQERQNWTLQRIVSTPTPRWVYLGGRLLGVFASGMIQMGLLLLITPIFGMMFSGNSNVWGTNYLGLFLITFTVVFAGTGLGLVIAAASKDAQQADLISTPVLFISGMLGGSFVTVEGTPVLNEIRLLTLNHWGIDGYLLLSTRNATLGEIIPHMAALLLMGVLFFLIALFSFNRRLNF